MFEFAVTVILGLMLLMLWKLKPLPPIKQPFYFGEEDELLIAREGSGGKISFYTVAEFNETQTVSASGLQKRLGFSDFPLVYDCNSERIKIARVGFIASDGYRRRSFIGLFEYLNEQEDWLEMTIQLSISEYDSLFKDLKQYSNRIHPNGRHFFLFELQTETGVRTARGASLNVITSISNVSIYPQEDAHKIRAMIALQNGLTDSDEKYRLLCEEKMRRFFQVIGREYDSQRLET